MKRTLTVLTALVSGLIASPFAVAQAAAAAPAPAATVPAAAVPAKIALVNFEQVVFATNEGQVAAATVQKKFEPRKNDIEKMAADVDAMKKQLAALPANTPDDERASKLRAIDTKEKQLNRDYEDLNTTGNQELQEALGKVAAKINVVMQQYVQQNGYTLLLDVSAQTSNVLWALPSTNVSQVIVDAYNKQSGVAAPPPPSPRASTPRTPAAKKP